MSIQRWDMPGDYRMVARPDDGPWVAYADHVAAYEDVKKRAYLHGLDRAREAVAVLADPQPDVEYLPVHAVLAAIDALRPVTCTRCKDTGWTGRADDPDSCDCGRNQ
jgi:hypothetical protein